MLEIKAFHRRGAPLGMTLPKREWNAMRRDALVEVEAFYRSQILPRHFTVEGAKKYGYTPRSGEQASGKKFWQSYTGRKQKRWGHKKPMVWSGKSETLAKQHKYTVSAAKDRATLRIRIAAPALNYRNMYSEIDMRKEITTVTPDEVKAMEQVYLNALERMIGQRQRAVTVVYREGSITGGGSMADSMAMSA